MVRDLHAARTLIRGLIVLLVAIDVSACSEIPLAPSFNLAGEWNGSWFDPTIIDATAQSPTGDFQLIIREDGTGSGYGKITFETGSNILSAELSLEIEVYTDGAVYGTGTHTVTLSDQTYSLEGEIIGQLDVHKLRGNGVMRIDIEGVPSYIEWSVEKS